jgi:DNA-binding MarR family transcriptional regulator
MHADPDTLPLDSVDRIVEAWAEADPRVKAAPLHVVGRLLLCAHHLQGDLVAALAPFGLSFGDFDVINTLRRRADPRGTNPGELARSSLITTGAMTTRLNRLEGNGLIRRGPDTADGRGVRVHLTRRGRRLAEQALDAVIAADEAFLEPLTEEERDAVAAALKLVLLRREQPAPAAPPATRRTP